MTTPFFRRWTVLGLLLLVSACGAYGQKPATTPIDVTMTAQPSAAIGPLEPVSVGELGLTMLAPSNWSAPVLMQGNDRLILSPDGSTDTSPAAGPFLYVIPDAAKYTAAHLSYTFRPDIADPAMQLDLLMQAINLDAPSYDPTESYIGAQYPAAIKKAYVRANTLTFVLLNAGSGRWIYVGAQAPERLFTYYDDAVFKPATNSIMLK